MFNLIMGILMVGVGCLCLVWAFFSKTMAVQIFFGCAMMIFGIVEIIRSKSIRERKKRAKNREFDAYMMMAQQMGVIVNPITGEIVSKNKDGDADKTALEQEDDADKTGQNRETDADKTAQEQETESEKTE